ncbi:MAG: LuxR family transcriptional regulator [Spirochaetales bacterium]|nr:LuxR family transcriptional regulator [Spirochaetales bacterium]
MNRFLDSVQKQIGVLISVVGLAVVGTNIANLTLLEGLSLWQSLCHFAVWSVFLFTVLFIISAFFESPFLKKMQVIVFLVVGTLNILDAYNEFYGPAMYLAAWLVMRHYGYLEKHAVAKNTTFLVVITVLSQISSALNAHYKGITGGMLTLLYTTFLVTLIVIIWRDMVRQQQQLRKENYSLKMDYTKLSNQLKEIEKEQKPFDLKAMNISPAEERVIKTLTVYRASNREIAERLNIAESTVKLHMYNICNKIGVDNRFAIIDLCKYNFATTAGEGQRKQ